MPSKKTQVACEGKNAAKHTTLFAPHSTSIGPVTHSKLNVLVLPLNQHANTNTLSLKPIGVNPNHQLVTRNKLKVAVLRPNQHADTSTLPLQPIEVNPSHQPVTRSKLKVVVLPPNQHTDTSTLPSKPIGVNPGHQPINTLAFLGVNMQVPKDVQKGPSPSVVAELRGKSPYTVFDTNSSIGSNSGLLTRTSKDEALPKKSNSFTSSYSMVMLVMTIGATSIAEQLAQCMLQSKLLNLPQWPRYLSNNSKNANNPNPVAAATPKVIVKTHQHHKQG